MGKPTDVRLLRVAADTERFAYRTPLKFGGRIVSDVVLLNVEAEVETRDGRRAVGRGSMTTGNVWAWPSKLVSPDESLRAMLDLGGNLAARADAYRGAGHPLEIVHELAADYAAAAREVCGALAEPMPKLAQLVAASPVEAAIFDAHGKALGANCYDLLGPEFVGRDLAAYLDADFAGEHLDRYTLRRPKERMPLYHLIGALDPLTPADVQTPLDDGLPQTLGEWTDSNGLTHFKIKLAGDDLAWDVERVTAVDRVLTEVQARRGTTAWRYSADFNEKCPNVEYLLEFLRQVAEKTPAGYDRLQYLEQPTARDLRAHPEHKMHAAAAMKPVVIDESLVDYESLLLAREQGYSGVALKACKGMAEALLMGAAAQKHRLFLAVQDLTCVGASFLWSATLSARIPTVAAIEGNGRQFCPVGNAPWEERFPSMFRVSDGTVGTGVLDGPGLGF